MQINRKGGRDDGGYADLPPAFGEEQANRFEGEAVVRRGRDEEGENTAVRRNESIIDAGSSFDGRYEAGEDLRILGSVSGEIICRGVLTIEKDAKAKARIEAREAVVRGTCDGDIVCSGRLVLAGSAVVNGTIKAATFVVEEGATITGTVQTTPAGATTEAPAAPAAAAPIPLKGEKAAAEETAETPASGGRGANTRWTSRNREAPNFALVSSEERAATLDRN
ncbi:MAG TPA: polymer-forming cytoskeletal protein [Tepidiformaceae bacterium]|nr:polymer-forming cytoskeletal protein [Thermoflexaceae bacterium]HMS58396.1 polymer-forming cytoskeletal protein [Tepidiformaceae bacterium]